MGRASGEGLWGVSLGRVSWRAFGSLWESFGKPAGGCLGRLGGGWVEVLGTGRVGGKCFQKNDIAAPPEVNKLVCPLIFVCGVSIKTQKNKGHTNWER